jgi:hypothetical protein
MINPIYVSCHLCHSQVGEPCKSWTRPLSGSRYCSRREDHAKRFIGAEHSALGFVLTTDHALVHGAHCTADPNKICTKCGRLIEALKNIPTLLKGIP